MEDESDSESNGNDVVPLDDSSDEEPSESDKEDIDEDNVKTGDYVLVRFASKKHVKHYVGLVLTMGELEAQVTFFKKKGNTYQSPEQEDTSFVDLDNIILKLPEPQFVGGASRAGTTMSFGIDLSDFAM